MAREQKLINKDVLMQKIKEGLTIYELSLFFSCSEAHISRVKKKHDLNGLSTNTGWE